MQVDPEHLLKWLDDEGDHGSDYDDGKDGWFSWRVLGDRLIVAFEDASTNVKSSAVWILTRLEENK